LIGGKVSKIDGVHNKLGVSIFGGGQWEMAFDERTHFYRDGVETTFGNIKKGDRVYVDTMLDGHWILARSVRVVTQTGPPDARGQVIAVDEHKMVIVDELLTEPLQFRVTDATRVERNGQSAQLADVRPGSQIAVHFSPEKANRDVAQKIAIVAAPGEIFTFAGKVTHLDLHLGTLAVENRTDSRTYDISFDPEVGIPPNLMIGSEVTIAAAFDGHHYKANRINVPVR
jgi:hypothetical protein